MPFVCVRAVKERLRAAGPEKRDAMAADISKAIAEGIGVPADAVWVVFEEVAAEDWYVGGSAVAKQLDDTT